MNLPIIHYRPFIAQREDGSQILISVFVDDAGRLESIQVAERLDRWDSWRTPLPVGEAP